MGSDDVTTDHVALSFADEPDATFRVNRERRTIFGKILPWNKVALSGGVRWQFRPHSLWWRDVSRVKAFRDHDISQPVARAVNLDSRADGLWGTVKVASGDEGDKLLSLADEKIVDGFSAGVVFDPNDGDFWERDPESNVRLVHRGRLAEITLTALPSFDDARVQRVTAQGERTNVAETTPTREGDKGTGQQTPGEPTVLSDQSAAYERFKAEVDERFDALTDRITDASEKMAQAVTGAFDSAFQRLEGAQASAQARMAAARFEVVKEPPIYAFDGDVHKPSLVRDAWNYHTQRDFDARDRLRKFQEQQNDLVKLAQVARFAPIDTTSASDVVPPGYRPDLFVTQLMQGRPIVAQMSRGTITDATPFTVPQFVSASVAGDHTEMTNPTPGTLTLDSTVVQPGAISGIFELSREIVDSSNPAIDAIAMQAMREDWNQQTEQKAFTALNGAADAANTETFAATDPTGGTGVLYDTRDLLARYSFVRFASPTGAVINQTVTRDFANANDTTGRPLLPSIGAQNTAGLGNAVQQGWFVDGLPFIPAWAMTDGSEDDVAIITNRADSWSWESPLLTFRFEEKRGPAVIELALFGYYGTHVLRPAGIFAIRNPV